MRNIAQSRNKLENEKVGNTCRPPWNVWRISSTLYIWVLGWFIPMKDMEPKGINDKNVFMNTRI